MDEPSAADARPGVLVVLAGVVGIAAGATTLVQGLQLATLFVFYSWMWVLPYVLMPLGLLQMALAALTTGGRDWAAGALTVVTWLLQGMALGFLVWSLQGGIIVLAFVWVGLNGLASLLAPVAVPGAMKASRAKRALYADLEA